MILSINTIEAVRQFARQLVAEGLSFHPDDDFFDYQLSSGEPFYTKEEAQLRNQLMEACFAICEQEEEDIYAVMGDVFLIETGLAELIPLSGNKAA